MRELMEGEILEVASIDEGDARDETADMLTKGMFSNVID